MLETIIVTGILIVAFFFVGRSIYQTMTDSTNACKCSSKCTDLTCKDSLKTPDNNILNKRT